MDGDGVIIKRETVNTDIQNEISGIQMHAGVWYRLQMKGSDVGLSEFHWPEASRRMWEMQLRAKMGMTPEEFGRLGLGGRYPNIGYRIHVFFPEDIPITGHYFYHRMMKENLMGQNYEHCRGSISFSKVKEYCGTGAMAIRSKYVLRKLAEESPLFAPIWEDLKDISPDDCGIYLAEAPDAAWLASIQPNEQRLFDEFRNPFGLALAGMESADNSPEGRECLAVFRRIQGKKPFEEVKNAFEQMVGQAFDIFEFWESYVLYLLGQDIADWASDALQVAQGKYPDCLMLDKLGALCCMELGEWDRAERHLKRYWGANPWDPFVILTYARVAIKKSDFPLAAQLYVDCVEHGCLGYGDMLDYGMALFLTRRCEAALSVFQKLESSNYLRSTIFNNIGMALAALGRWQEAVQYCRRSLESDPSYRFAWDSLGFAHLKGGQYAEAIPALLKAVELEPNYPDAWRHLLHAYHKNGDADRLEGAKTYVGRVLPDQLARFEREKGADILD